MRRRKLVGSVLVKFDKYYSQFIERVITEANGEKGKS